MIKKILFFLLMLSVHDIHSQIVNIPDANFKAKLLASTSSSGSVRDLSGNFMALDINGNGEIEVSEAALVGHLTIVGNPNPVTSLQGIQAFSNIVTLVVLYNNIPTMDLSGLQYLTTVVCNNNNLNELNVSSCPQLHTLKASLNPLISLNLANSFNLYSLDIEFTDITSLDLSGFGNLFELLAQQINLTSIDLSGCNNLDFVDIRGHYLTSLDVSNLASLRDLNCTAGTLIQINVAGCSALEKLTCVSNELSSLDLTGLSSLEEVYCGGNVITSLLMNGCSSLEVLWCDTNQLQTLDLTQAQNITDLQASYNEFSVLDLSGLSQLYFVDVSNNILTYIELDSHPALYTLNVRENLLSTIDAQNCPALSSINVGQNPNLTSVFAKTGNNTFVSFWDCPNLQYICVDPAKVYTTQGAANNQGLTNCHVNTYCSFTPGGNFYTMQGESSLDFGSDGCDIQDPIFPFMKFTFNTGTTTGSYIANFSGNYNYAVQQGSHTITPVMENPAYFNVSPTSASITFPQAASPHIQNFCITPNGVHPDLEIVLIPLNVAQPGFDAQYKIIYRNLGNVVLSGTITIEYNEALGTMISATQPYSQTPDVLSFNFSNLGIFEFREIDFSININTPMQIPPVNNGDILTYTATITAPGTDESPLNNTFTLAQIVVNSYDPNDKTCLEGNIVGEDMINAFVHYLIRFENTGTYPAQNVVIRDIIDTSKFDISTLIPLIGSHPFTTKITEGNRVEFIFENIQLPFDDANNDGFIAFKIKTKPTLTVGNTFSNFANIFFDYNYPIVTNTATTTISELGTNTFLAADVLTLYPNPAGDVLNIRSSNDIKSYSIYNLLGQPLLVDKQPGINPAINISALPRGSYLVRIILDKGTFSSKFIKQ